MNIDKVSQQAISTYRSGLERGGGVNKPEQAGNGGKAGGAHAGPQSDQVTITQQANQMRQAEKVVREQPDVRMDKVQALQKQIEEGTFQVDSRGIAQKILEGLQ